MRRPTPPPSARRRRPWAVAGLVAATVVGVGSGAAYGSFTTAGGGSGAASVGRMQAVALVVMAGGDSPTTALVPGGAADVVLRVDNPNAGAVTLVSATGDGAVTASGGVGLCAPTGVAFVNQSHLHRALPPGSSLVHLLKAATMDVTSATGCQGATFSIPVTITVHAP